MAENKNLIKRFSYDEPYSKTCYKRVCAFGKCHKIPYPCIGMQTKVIEIYSVAYYPDEATPEQKASTAACTATALTLAYNACLASYATVTSSTAGVGIAE